MFRLFTVRLHICTPRHEDGNVAVVAIIICHARFFCVLESSAEPMLSSIKITLNSPLFSILISCCKDLKPVCPVLGNLYYV